MSEPRTAREARSAIREIEAAAERVHMSPSMAVSGFGPGWYVRQARLALRQAERALAKADDPRLEPLKPLRPQITDRRPSLRPRRSRFRCTTCFHESLRVAGHGLDCYLTECDGIAEPVVRRKTR